MINIHKKYVLVLGLILSLGACKKELDLNLKNPNGVTSSQISGKDVFANALQNTSGNTTNNYAFASQWMGVWARTSTYSASSGAGIEDFNLLNSFGDGIWAVQYHNILDYNFVQSHSSDKSILVGASKVMKALVFQNLVDVFGNVPYTEAANPDLSIHPKYDDAATIYKSIITDINAGITAIKSSSSTADDASDLLFKGDKSKWVRFANTLKLRILLRQVPNGDLTYVKSAIADIVSEGSGFLGAGEDATINPGYADVAGGQNPYWSVYGFAVGGGGNQFGHGYYIANQTMMDYLGATKDPRIGSLYDTTAGKYFGLYLGTVNTTIPSASVATIGSGVLQSPSQDAIVLLATESFFLQAEAAQRGLISGNYSNLLQTAIEESFRYLKIPNAIASADAYYTNSSDDRVNPKNGTDPIKAIIYQKWVALSEIDGLETWSEYRRTGYPDRTNPTTLAGVSPADNVIPKKLLYPQSEYTLNSTIVTKENQGSNGFRTKLFWGQ